MALGSFVGEARRHLPVVLLMLTSLAMAARCGGSKEPVHATHLLFQGSSDYGWNLPKGFPAPRVPADNPMSAAKVELGRRLFYDTRLSLNQKQSCASCHQQELAFSDARRTALGSTGHEHFRNSMGLANVAYAASYTWADGEVDSLEKQVLVPLLNEKPVEMGWAHDARALVNRLRDEPVYTALFAAAFPDQSEPLTLGNLTKALAAFERTLISGNSPYDRFMFDQDQTAMSDSSKRGMTLFFSDRFGCFRCHGGLNFSGAMNVEGGSEASPSFHYTAAYGFDEKGRYQNDDSGLATKSGRLADMGRFRVPTLRNVALTAPYMHDGSMASLEQVLDHYAVGGRGRDVRRADVSHAERASIRPEIQPILLTRTERDDLIAFLRALTDESFVRDPRFSNPW